MSTVNTKSKKQLILELLELEQGYLGDVGEPSVTKPELAEPKDDCINGNEELESITKPKRKLSEKQLDALKKGQQKRDDNRERMKAEKKAKEEEEKKILEEKLVKKAIAVKKKQIKKQALLDEISDDEKPVEKQEKQEKPFSVQALKRTTSGPLILPPQEPQKPKIVFV